MLLPQSHTSTCPAIAKASSLTLIPNVDVLLALQPEELGPAILKLAAARMQNGMFNAQQVLTVSAARGMTATQVTPYAADKEREVNVALFEAWQWLVLNTFRHYYI